MAFLRDNCLIIAIIAAVIVALEVLALLRRLFKRLFRTPVPSPTFGDVLGSLENRIKKLEAEERGIPTGEQLLKLTQLIEQVNDWSSRELAGQTPIPALSRHNMGEFKRTLRAINMRLGQVEAGRLELPPSNEDRKRFRKDFGGMTPEELADRRYLGIWGNYDTDARKSNWRVIEANRFIVRRQHEDDVSRDWWLAVVAIVVAFVMGAVATGAAVLAIPTEKSLFCQFGIAQWIGSDLACK